MTYYQQDADRALLLDELGEHLRSNLKLKEGLISKEAIVYTLNQSVSYYFLQLQTIVWTLSSNNLLEYLVSHHEAIVSEQAFRKITVVCQILCKIWSGARLVAGVDMFLNLKLRTTA